MHGEHDEPSAESVLMEINGYDLATRRPLSSFTEMKADGSTLGGCWIYTGGVYADGVNQAARRKSRHEQSFVAPEWGGWAWPMNRRILYNRASADPEGRPWSERKATCGGTPARGGSGRVRTCRTSRGPNRRTIARPKAPTVSRRSRGSTVHHAG